MSILNIAAQTKNLPNVLDFVHGCLASTTCPDKTKLQIDLAVEEFFVNIANYAYGDKIGSVTIRCSVDNKTQSISIILSDSGIAFDPLAHPEAETNLPTHKRKIGGLGIFLSRKIMDEVSYQRENHKNILTLKKTWCE